MNFLTILGIAFGLAMDAFAVSIACGCQLERLSGRHLFRLSFHFGLFQFLMPIVGWFGGSKISFLVHNFDHWIAFGLLMLLGMKMIKESFAPSDSFQYKKDPTRKWSLVLLSLATSIDALAVGLSLALLDINIVRPSIIIGIVAAAMTLIGMIFGRQLGARFGSKMAFLGGIILIAIGSRVLWSHLTD
jgi:putative Mn2+ efflux pump MntP